MKYLDSERLYRSTQDTTNNSASSAMTAFLLVLWHKSVKNSPKRFNRLMEDRYIHSLTVTAYPVQGKLEPIPADYGREAAYTLDKSPGYRRAMIQYINIF